MKRIQSQYVLDKKVIPADKNAYIFRNPNNLHRWHLYYYDRNADKRYRLVLTNSNGVHPANTIEGQDDAWLLGIAKFVELKGKSDRGESINSITFKEMCDKFLNKERKRVSNTPHKGITKVRYRLLTNQVRWLRDYLNNDKKPIHRIRRQAFSGYESWRIERAKEFGKEEPRETTINQELTCCRRMFKEVGVAYGYLTDATMPEIKSVKLSKDKKHRRDDFTPKEWEILEKTSRLYWQKGRTRILDSEYTIKKNSSGQYETKTVVTAVSKRGQSNLIHRQLYYNAMRISMETGIRVGSLKQLRWKHISTNTALPKKEQKIWVSINVPAESTKTGRSYRIAAPIARFIEVIRKISRFKKPNDYIFCNQLKGTMLTERVWVDYFKEVLVEARLADWGEEDKRGTGRRIIEIHSGKNLTFYSFRHSYITFALNRGVPLPTIAAQTDTSMKYIQEHYFHYRADEATEILGKGREKFLKSSMGSMGWMDDIESGTYKD